MTLQATQQRIPVAILTGFLGSGKTTVLRHLGHVGELNRTLVLVNEFGEVGIDHHLLTPIDDDTLVAVESGCICCTIRSDLVRTLSEAHWRYARNGERWFDRVVIETTGIADPAPIMQTIIGEPSVAKHYALAGVVTAVDAVNGVTTLERYEEAAKQVAVADHLLLTKTDLAHPDEPTLQQTLRRLAPSAPVSRVADGKAEIDWFFASENDWLAGKIPAVEAWLQAEEQASAATQEHDHHHDHSDPAHDLNRHNRIQASSLIFEQPVDAALLDSCLGMLMQFRGADLLRVKGIVNVIGMDRPMVIHGVQHVFHPPEVLPQWPSDDRRTRIVMIAQDLDHAVLRTCFEGFGLAVSASRAGVG